VGEPERLVLMDVGEVEPEGGAVSDGGSDFSPRVADDDADLSDAGVGGASRPWKTMGRLATGTSCFALVWVSGRSQLPDPPQRTIAFTRARLFKESQHPRFGDPQPRD